jgi:phospholipid/cholesterol/gamma-HCH transport system substrate-binding protein
VLLHTKQLSRPFKKTVEGFGKGLGALNYGFNEFAYNPPGNQQGYLFYLPWFNHNLNATYLNQDATGPIRRSIVMLSCNSATLAAGAIGVRPFIRTLQEGTNVPTNKEICK